MKKLLSIILSIIFAFALSLPSFAESESQPKIMVTEYKSDSELKYGQNTKLFITLTNKSKTDAVKNMKIVFSDPSGDILPSGRSSGYVEALGNRKSVTWELDVIVSEEAKNGAHSVNISCEFETSAGSGSSSDNFTLNVIGKPETTEEATTVNSATPRLMVTDYSVENGSIVPGESRILNVTIKNTSPSKAVSNIKLSLSDESGELKTDGMGTAYIKSISAGGNYTWSIALTAAHTAKTGEHSVNLSMEYEDSNQTSYTASDTIRIDVRQSVKMSFDSAKLPTKVIQGETVTVSINLMNTGKSILYNSLIDVDVEGLESGGSVLVGEIPLGESKTGSINLRVSSEILGNVEGTITITYEDDIGETYEEIVEVSTVIVEKTVKAETRKEEENKNPLWWLFIIIGAIAGGGLGFGIPYTIYSNKQRKEDEKRL